MTADEFEAPRVCCSATATGRFRPSSPSAREASLTQSLWATSTATAGATWLPRTRTSNTASVLLGNGNGTFQARQSFGTGSYPYSVAVGDFNSDGRRDLVTADEGSNTASVLLGNGNGTFQAKQSFGTGTTLI